MSHKMHLPFLISLICFYFMPSVLTNIIENLKDQIDKIENETVMALTKKRELSSELKSVPITYQKQIFDVKLNDLNHEEEVELEKLKTMRWNISNLDDTVQELTLSVKLLQAKEKKLDFGSKILERDISEQETRRNLSEHLSCFELEKIKPFIKLRSRIKIDQIENPEEILLGNELSKALREVVEVRNENELLKMEISSAKVIWGRRLSNVVSSANMIKENIKLAKESNEALVSLLQIKNTEIESLKEKKQLLEEVVEEKSENIEKLSIQLKQFQTDVSCYRKLLKDINAFII